MPRPKGKYKKPIPITCTCAYAGCSNTFDKVPASPKKFCHVTCGAREYWRLRKLTIKEPDKYPQQYTALELYSD